MRFAILSLLGAMVLLGCKKKEMASSDTGATVPQSDPATQASPRAEGSAPEDQPIRIVTTEKPKPLPAPPPYVAARAENALRQGIVGEVQPFLTEQLRIFVQKNHRMPESFGEFSNSRLDSIPRPPEGTKWVIDTASVQVKAVKTKQ
jgi:hypothetical protein